MKLSTRLSGDFETPARRYGQAHYWYGRVHIQHGCDTDVAAYVQCSRTYQVTLDLEDVGVLYAYCHCPDFEQDGPCEHIWATILAAEERGYLSAAATAPGLYMDFSGDLLEEPELLRPRQVAPQPPVWRKQVTEICNQSVAQPSDTWPAKRQILYIVDVPASISASALTLSLASRDRKADGGWSRQVALAMKRAQIAHLPVPEDRKILASLAGVGQSYTWSSYGAGAYEQIPSTSKPPDPLGRMLIQAMARTDHCYLQSGKNPEDMTPLVWDDGGPWQFALEMRRREPEGWAVAGVFRRGEERLDLAATALVTKGLIFTRDRVAPLPEDTPLEWMIALRKMGRPIEAPEADKDELLKTLLCAPGLPALEVPEELRYKEVTIQPRPCLRVLAGDRGARAAGRLQAELSFDYNGRLVPESEQARAFFEAEERRLLRRDSSAEESARALLKELGLRFQWATPGQAWDMAPTKLPRVVRKLVEAGWHIEAEGKVFRRPGAFRIEVSTGVDWFELHGGVEYGETSAKLPELLQALRKGENMVRLDDGTYGVLPEEWLRRIGPLAGLGTPESGHLRFRPTQAGLLDALLATQPEAQCDEAFSRVREELCRFQGVEAVQQPAGFVGQLRDYQREGLGWMEFLRRFSFGGCLADDMGVGKTAQVLALFEARRAARAETGQSAPSLVVVPRSLVFNWKQEAERFTPQLRVLDHTGLARDGNDFAGYDVVLTTYGTVRRDILRLKDIEFDYLVLDEAQAVKNANTESAKAVRLLRGQHRLALSGTPVENHLGELWSLFEFLNPGMLGTASVFKLTGGAARKPDDETRQLLAHALRPFILRRTKQQVARELPEKTEQTLYCELEGDQRKLYDELREHYRSSLLKKIETDGLAKSKIQVLEALLRLRQAACHPGLLDPKRFNDSSAKLETLLEQLREVLDEGHKALVFSQFTSLLAIVRERLDRGRIPYEYLDGATRDRQACVERFQNDADCRLFLISLKAGGLGLNLTAAEYVFLLDPWWNPAVEAQAIDRAHRIGQARQVFAYRLIARGTVEEKVLELQQTKRDLAAAIISADNSLIGNLRREDLELLLS